MMEGEATMRSRDAQRQPNIPKGNCQREEAVNPQGTGGVPSALPAQEAKQPREETYDLMEKVVERGNMTEAYKRVMANKGAAGIDGMGLESLRPYLKEEWSRIKQELLEGTYRPQPVRRVEIPKPQGGTRKLGIPTVVDRLIQQALNQILMPIFDPDFSTNSYGFRPGKIAHQAVKKAKEYIADGYRWVVDMDLAQFFDRVNHDILMARVARKVKDKRILKLIREYLKAGVMLNGIRVKSEEGTPQGGPLSPLLANIILDDLDKALESRGHRFCRYADDCNVYVRSRRAGQRVMEGMAKFLEGRLKLQVNWEKSAVDRPWNRKFLGFSFTWHKAAKIRLAPQTVKRVKEKIRQFTGRSRSIAMEDRLDTLNQYLKGWMGYFRLIDTPSVLKELDEWLRRRLRMCLLKQWKRPKTRRRNLVALGIPEEWACNISGSRKGYWRLALTPQMNKALGLAYWREQGLVSLVETYQSHRQPA
ncbi:reverse transcriptase (RNA-dependent DNA polymerase) [Heliomicrobium modesticaldum Ice1]|uniref:RNA-directed DNA polymerase n=1 Tax=Heliobacterium modesticaldum (strain ATCC 51547 / Ice1) TaxID=498761 RepID=B0TA94_HELMI|nr:group II intron reverse transcriptase/maturase [Heliomicrobium modesticaldum]ABZ83631.1 reverse transcriptase (RNA-dependent DNA polymerase) [Heliomicrobium modesticaldum Ice1]